MQVLGERGAGRVHAALREPEALARVAHPQGRRRGQALFGGDLRRVRLVRRSSFLGFAAGRRGNRSDSAEVCSNSGIVYCNACGTGIFSIDDFQEGAFFDNSRNLVSLRPGLKRGK